MPNGSLSYALHFVWVRPNVTSRPFTRVNKERTHCEGEWQPALCSGRTSRPIQTQFLPSLYEKGVLAMPFGAGLKVTGLMLPPFASSGLGLKVTGLMLLLARRPAPNGSLTFALWCRANVTKINF